MSNNLRYHQVLDGNPQQQQQQHMFSSDTVAETKSNLNGKKDLAN